MIATLQPESTQLDSVVQLLIVAAISPSSSLKVPEKYYHRLCLVCTQQTLSILLPPWLL